MWTKLIQLLSIFPCDKKTKVIEVPEAIHQQFLDFIDSANTLLLTQEDLNRNSGLAELAEVIDGILGEQATPRCQTRKELKGIYRVWSQ